MLGPSLRLSRAALWHPRRVAFTPGVLAIVLGVVGGACIGASPRPPSTPSPTSAPTTTSAAPSSNAALESDVDPVGIGVDPAVSSLAVTSITERCTDHLAAAKALLSRLRDLKNADPASLRFETTLGRMDRVALEIKEASYLPYLVALVHPDPAVRAAAKLCEPKAEELKASVFLDADAATVIQAYADKRENLSLEKQRLLAEVLRDFRRNGVNLALEKRKELFQHSQEITRTGQEFQSNIAGALGRVDIGRKQLDGLPDDYKAKHPAKASGKVEITTSAADYFPFITLAHDRRAAAELYVSYTNRGGNENVQLLERLLQKRSEKAKLLGYATWADFAIEPRMAKTPAAVRTFLSAVSGALRAPAKAEIAEMMHIYLRSNPKPSGKIGPQERYYLTERVRAEKFKLKSADLANYFEVGRVLRGVMDVAAAMFGLEFKEAATQAWHPDVKAYDVIAAGETMGRLYLDAYARADKFQYVTMFPVRASGRLQNGSRILPVAALACSFPKPGDKPAVISHEDVATLFHEFGHVLHHLLTRSELATYAGTSTVRDFVQVPSQVFEEWAWSREVLDRFAEHVTTHEKISDGLFAAMTSARRFGRALETERQVFLSTLDLELHSREPGFDSTAVVEEVEGKIESFGYVKGTHFQSGFGHLVSLDAAYYSYPWAIALAHDVLTRWKAEGFMNPKTASAFRDEILAKGGGADERAMLRSFLGREPNNDAYFAYLNGKE